MAMPHQRLADLGIGIRLRGTRHDPCVLEEIIRVKDREQLEGLFKVIDHLLCRDVVGITRRVKGADAGAVFAPFVLPE